jgi:hypothetical protein
MVCDHRPRTSQLRHYPVLRVTLPRQRIPPQIEYDHNLEYSYLPGRSDKTSRALPEYTQTL